MLEHGETEGQRPVLRSSPCSGGMLRFCQLRTERLETSPQQVLLAGVVGIEGGAADIGLVDDVLDRDRVVALAQDQRHQRTVQRLPRTGRATIHHLCPKNSRTMALRWSDSEQRPPFVRSKIADNTFINRRSVR